MWKVSLKNISIVICILKIILIFIIFNKQNILLFFAVLILLSVIFIAEIILIRLKKYNRTFILITVLLIIGILPIMILGKEYGPTFGNKIKYNEILWKYSFNDNIRYYMANDIVKTIIENKYSKNNIIKMLGEPDFGNFTYFLKNNNLFIGLDMYVLSIEFVDNKCNNVNILRMD